jgi:hypothetical protein
LKLDFDEKIKQIDKIEKDKDEEVSHLEESCLIIKNEIDMYFTFIIACLKDKVKVSLGEI